MWLTGTDWRMADVARVKREDTPVGAALKEGGEVGLELAITMLGWLPG